MKLIKQLVQENICVIAEGKIHTPEQARQIKSWVLQELSLVVQLHDHKKLLKRFVDVLNKEEKDV